MLNTWESPAGILNYRAYVSVHFQIVGALLKRQDFEDNFYANFKVQSFSLVRTESYVVALHCKLNHGLQRFTQEIGK